LGLGGYLLGHKAIAVKQTQIAMLLKPSNQLYSVAFSQTEKKKKQKGKTVVEVEPYY